MKKEEKHGEEKQQDEKNSITQQNTNSHRPFDMMFSFSSEQVH